MNFSDFGVKDESELEQDEFSLNRPTFGKDNQLTVIGWKGKLASTKYYIVKCSKCIKDPELFGDGIFKITKGHLRGGRLPCGCSSHIMWSGLQYEILVRRECRSRGHIFHGFAEEFKGNRTKLVLECQTHGVWKTTGYSDYLSGYGCSKCGRGIVEAASTKEDSFHINKFVETGKYPEKSVFWRSDKVNTSGVKAHWFFKCPICSEDEYTKAGLCSGTFEVLRSDLKMGILPCRCSDKPNWTKEQYEYRIKKKMLENKTTDKFIGFINGFKNINSFFTRECVFHGSYDTRVANYLNSNHSCPLCGSHSQKECYINFIKDKETLIALKFGIAKDSEERIKSQNRESSFDVKQHGVWSFPDVKSCKSAERYIKKHLPCKVLTKQEMPDGYTETTSVENLETIIKIYEDFGGVRKIISNKEKLTENNKNKEAA